MCVTNLASACGLQCKVDQCIGGGEAQPQGGVTPVGKPAAAADRK
jgi:hypothetical protein